MNRSFLATGIAALLLTACGGGGGDDDPTPATTTPVATTTPFDTVTDPADDPVATPDPVDTLDPIGTPDPVATPASNDESDPVATEPVVQAPDPTPPASTDPLAPLFGRVTVDYSFTAGASDRFRIVADFSPANVQEGAARLVLDPLASLSGQVDGETLPEVPAPFGCSLLESSGLFSCIQVLGDASTFFLFTPPTGGRTDGLFEFCPAGRATSVCADNLLASPDGAASLSIGALASRNAAPPTVAGFDLAPYVALAAQRASAAPSRGSADPVTSAEISAARDALSD